MLSVLVILMSFENILLVVSNPFKMCLNPIKVKYNDNYKKYRGVLIHSYNPERMLPCGKCYQCSENKIEEWLIRWQNQLSESLENTSYLLTLTYSDDHLPEMLTPDGEIISTLQYSDVQKFLKRLRKRQQKISDLNNIPNPKIYYHVCGEYGKRFTKRPHYHMLITNLIIPQEEIQKIWKLGSIHIGTDVTEKTIKYVLKYTLKNSLEGTAKTKKVYKEINKIIQGSAFVMDYPIEIYEKLNVKIHNPDFIETQVTLKKKLQFKYYIEGPNKYRVAEKTLCSKGIGKNWLTPENIKLYRENPALNYRYLDAQKEKYKDKPLPRYYKEEIYNPKLRENGKLIKDDHGRTISLWSPLHPDYENTPRFKKQLYSYQQEVLRQEKLFTIIQYQGLERIYQLRESQKINNENNIQKFKKLLILQDDKNYKSGIAYIV